MKKLVALVMLSMMIVSVFAVNVSAQSVNAQGSTPTGTTAIVKRADPANVAIDGVIGDGEYERLDIDTDPDSSFLHLVFGTGDVLEKAQVMLESMQYYASWCDGKINIAVRNKPAMLQQILSVKTGGDYPEDWFCRNVAYTISSDVKQTRDKGKQCNFYFAIAKRTDTGEYLVGYYGANQRGNSESYVPKAGEDFAIEYDHSSGYATMEWSIPFSEICETGTAGAGDSVYLCIGAEAGEGTEDTSDDFYAVSLGDFTYGVDIRSAFNHAAFQLSDDLIKKTGSSIVDDKKDNNGDRQTVVDTDKYEVKTDENGNEIIIDKATGKEVDRNSLPAVSAAGAFIVRKKRH